MLNNQVLEIKQNISRLAQAKKLKEACSLAEKLTKISPNDIEAWWVLAQLQHNLKNTHGEFEACLVVASNQSPVQERAIKNTLSLGVLLGRFQEILPLARKQAENNPTVVEHQLLLGICFFNSGQYFEAQQALGTTLSLEAGNVQALNLYALCCQFLGQHDTAIKTLKKSLKSEPLPTNPAVSNLPLASNYPSSISNHQVAEIHRNSAKVFLKQSTPSKEHRTISLCKEKSRIKIAFVSEDFRDHSISFFLLPVLENFSAEKWEVTLYSRTQRLDQISKKYKSLPVQWVDVTTWSDTDISEQIVKDKVDILIDLQGHMGKPWLGILANRCAPIQVTYLGYPNTTGLPNMDYRLVDPISDPNGDQYYTESLFRLNRGFLCFQPHPNATDVRERPGDGASRYFHFGSFNAAQKISEKTIELWASVLKAVPSSKLIIKSIHFNDPKARQVFGDKLRHKGIDPKRIIVMPPSVSKEEHFEAYSQIDIHLDTFPYNGTTTTCEALWQGVPTITLSGDNHRSRVGASILHHAGLDDWIASSEDEYLSIAVDKAKDLEALMTLRGGMRQRMSKSSLMDAKGMVSALEQAFDTMINEKSASQQK